MRAARGDRQERGAGGRERARARAASDAAVVADLLDDAQRRRYAGSGDAALTAQRVEAERFAVLLRAPSEGAGERESAAAALAADARTRRWSAHADRAQCGTLLVGSLFLVGGGLGLLLQSEVLFTIGALSLGVAALLQGARSFWSRRVAAREVRVLLDWASGRPGQLGRGLPLTAGTARTSLWTSDLAQKLMTVLALLGALLLGIEIWSLLRGVDPADRSGLLIPGVVCVGAGALYFIGGPLAHRAAARRDAAIEWLPGSHLEGRDDATDRDEDQVEQDDERGR